ncbi:B9 domain-containing protein 2-like [Oratosquilla oratoria]|uniref:B9 domain-containing protein 2-like n=1 Tax=Oratosquilla oratoria TaxID=337810 RepID=UPI003F7629DA
MAEVHIIGQITGATGFQVSGLFCKWSLQLGVGWRVVEGVTEGQTQVDCPVIDSEQTSWCHPVDIHLATRGIQGWPRIILQVFRQDDYGRVDLCSYGVIHVPTCPGTHKLTCHTWRPTGTFFEEVQRSLIGGGRQLLSTEYIHSGLDRYQLQTTPMGMVHLELGILLRNFEKHGISY